MDVDSHMWAWVFHDIPAVDDHDGHLTCRQFWALPCTTLKQREFLQITWAEGFAGQIESATISVGLDLFDDCLLVLLIGAN